MVAQLKRHRAHCLVFDFETHQLKYIRHTLSHPQIYAVDDVKKD